MPTTPYARLLVSLNGGAAAAGGVEAAASDDVDFVYEDTTGWPATPPPYLEIYEAPLNWSPVPATGWVATDGGGWKYYGTTPPPTIAAPDVAHFGKVAAQLVVGGGLKDGVLSVDMTSGATVLVRAASGLESLAHRETTEYDDVRAWVGAIQRDLRLINTALGIATGLDATTAVLEDTATALNANGVPIRNMTGTLEILSTARPMGLAREAVAAGTVEIERLRRTITGGGNGVIGTGGYSSWWLPNGAGLEQEAFRLNTRWLQTVGPYAEVALSLDHNGVLTERIVFSSAGAITTPGIITGANFVGVSLDRANAGALTLGGTNATSIAASGLKITGLADGAAASDAAAFGQIAAALGSYVPTSRTLTGTTPIAIAGDYAAHDLSANRTLSFLPSADVSMGGYGWTSCTGVTSAGALACTASGGAITIDASTGSIVWNKAAALACTDTLNPTGASGRVWATGVTSITDSWTQRTSGAGGVWTIAGQRGFAGSVGGKLVLQSGYGGTLGADLAGDLDLDVGQTVGGSTAKLNFVAGATGVIAWFQATTDYFYCPVQGSRGIYFAGSSIYLSSSTTATIDTTNGTLSLYKSGSLGATITVHSAGACSFVPAAGATSCTIKQAKLAGTGVTTATDTTVAAQDGRNVAAGTNNSGGTLILDSGAVGTGGTGGAAGAVKIRTGTADALVVNGDKSVDIYSTDVEWGKSQGGVWRDLHSHGITPDSGVTVPVLTAIGGSSVISLPMWQVDDKIWTSWHIDHDYVPGTDVYFHFHWTSDGTSTNNVRWQFTYYHARGHQQQAFSPALSGAGTVVSVTQAGQGTAYYHMIAETAAVTIANLEPDSVIICEVKRITAGTDNADRIFGVMGFNVDLHYLSSRPGTLNRSFPFT